MSKRLGGIIGCKYKTSSWPLTGPLFPIGIEHLIYMVCIFSVTVRHMVIKGI